MWTYSHWDAGQVESQAKVLGSCMIQLETQKRGQSLKCHLWSCWATYVYVTLVVHDIVQEERIL